MQERITIENFGGIKKADIPLNKINIFIGPQASGKSVIAKSIYFLKEFPDKVKMAFWENETKTDILNELKETFIKYFPNAEQGNLFPFVRIQNGEDEFSFKFSHDNKWTYKNPTAYDNFIMSSNEIISQVNPKDPYYLASLKNQKANDFFEKTSLKPTKLIFIPAGRLFFANLHNNIFSFLDSGISVDPFIVKFGTYYQLVKADEQLSITQGKSPKMEGYQDLIKGEYKNDIKEDFIMHQDGRKVNIPYASSGQQEMLPLIMVLKYLQNQEKPNDTVIIIEEPEAHLFPSAQKKIVELIASTFNSNPDRNIQFVITTHSPYILTSFNNLIQAGQLGESLPESSIDKLNAVVPKNQQLHLRDIAAYSVADGSVTDIIDKENNLIDAKIIDQVSNDIAIQFDQLLDLQ